MGRQKSAKSVVALMEKSYKKHRSMIEKAMSETEPGTTSHLNHINALAELDRKYLLQRSQRGLDPVNLGVAAAPQFVFRATIENGAVRTDQISAERQLWEERLNAEYSSGIEPTPVDPEEEAGRLRDEQIRQRYREEFGDGSSSSLPVLDQIEKELDLAPRPKSSKRGTK